MKMPEAPPAAAAGLFEKLGERTPYSDGSTRRRVLAGVIIALTVWRISGGDWALFETNVLNKFAHPLPAVAIAVAIYLLGTLVELVGNTSLMRAAGEGIGAAYVSLELGLPSHFVRKMGIGLGIIFLVVIYLLAPFYLEPPYLANGFVVFVVFVASIFPTIFVIGMLLEALRSYILQHNTMSAFRRLAAWRPVAYISFLLWWPLRVTFATIRGLLGFTKYSLGLQEHLSPAALATYHKLPDRVREGLDRPIGNFGDLGIHYVIQQYEETSNRRWARRLIARVQDVSVVVSASVIAILIVGGSDAYRAFMEPRPEVEAHNATRTQLGKSTVMSRILLNELVGNDAESSVLARFDPAIIKSTMEALVKPLQDGEMRKSLNSAIVELDQAITAESKALSAVSIAEGRRLLENVLLVLGSYLLLFLYLIFFVNLRGAIESMVEALAIEEAIRLAQPAASAPILSIAGSDPDAPSAHSAA